MAPFIVLGIIVYALVGFVTAVHLHDDRGMSEGHSVFGGILWPLVAYRALRNGWATDFWRKLNEATTRN